MPHLSEILYNWVTPAIGNTSKDWNRIIGELPHDQIQERSLTKRRVVQAITSILRPFRALESARYGHAIEQTEIHPEPIFVIGHWRSGTTHLHNLLCQDPQFGYVSQIQSLFPHATTSPLIPWITKITMPETRPMDSMKLYLNGPQEEEMALVNMGPYSLYHFWHFPNHMWEIYERMVPFKGPEKDREGWKAAYLELLRKATYRADGKPLVLKNPPNTGRIRLLLELFPKAKFIHIHRHPAEVYGSTLKLHRKVLPIFQLEEVSDEAIQTNILKIYRAMMMDFLEAKSAIPEGQFVELGHRELSAHPLAELAGIYEKLGLSGFAQAKTGFEKYLKGLSKHSKAQYQFSREEAEMLQAEWGFAFKAWNYEPPQISG
ncbi:sulfotransferase [Pontibacter sp. G13]|uniref:sulfotransferase family protein n=1 Tax=Pontibacter sp. G13 TaxID=3074898 RepID=UPI00288ABFC5|nr:sulfotransferase [Pontibacter sp. G13]WNJ19577.1 sulfotransferase [Pontibacter sp. G13]